MAERHPTTPSPKLVGDWLTEAADLRLLTPANLDYLATRAAQWGADQELEACVEQVDEAGYPSLAAHIRAARRPYSLTPCVRDALKRLAELESNP